MTNPPKLPPEVEKKFDEEFVVDFQHKDIKFFFAKVIAEEVEKAVDYVSEIELAPSEEDINAIEKMTSKAEAFGYGQVWTHCRIEERKRKIRYQLTPDPLSE